MAEAALKIIASPELRRRLAENGRRFAEENFSPAAIADQYEAAYGRALTLRGKSLE
jgi:glycosyltransferase involved in cell wall biosynthesis